MKYYPQIFRTLYIVTAGLGSEQEVGLTNDQSRADNADGHQEGG